MKLPYLGLALAILILGVLIAKSNLPALVVKRRNAAVVTSGLFAAFSELARGGAD